MEDKEKIIAEKMLIERDSEKIMEIISDFDNEKMKLALTLLTGMKVAADINKQKERIA